MGLLNDFRHLYIRYDNEDGIIYLEKFINDEHAPEKRIKKIQISLDEKEFDALMKIARECGYNEMGTFFREEMSKVYIYVYLQKINYKKGKDWETIKNEIYENIIKK